MSDSEICLISGQPLEDIVILDCGHKYNYEPLFKEIFNQKVNPSFKNDVIRLKPNQYKCPYCRKVQNTLLGDKIPLYSVTTLDTDYEIDPKFCFTLDHLSLYKLGSCDFPECSKKYVINKFGSKLKFCSIHIRSKQPKETKEEKMAKIALAKQEKAAEKAKAKEEAKIAKEKAKEEAKKEKAVEKAKAKEEAKIAKEKAKEAKLKKVYEKAKEAKNAKETNQKTEALKSEL